MSNPTELYVPLLNHQDPDVRRQASMILLSTYGPRGLTYLRRLLDAPDQTVREQARTALQSVAEASGLHVELQPFRGIYVRCLGDLQVFIDSHAIQSHDWTQSDGGRSGGRKVQGMFAYLIHCGQRGASRAEIGEAVWGGNVSTVSISRTLGTLRNMIDQFGGPQLAEQFLQTGRERIVLNPALYHTDADHFDRTFNLACRQEEREGLEAAAALYSQVLALYDGPYMEGVPRGHDWGEERRVLLAGNVVISAERLAEHAFNQNHDHQCIAYCRQALRIDPIADDVTTWLLRSYGRMGLQIDFERTYRRYLKLAGINPENEPEDPVVQIYRKLVSSIMHT
jgi:DNA-binding SARP family transcriptional activator